MTCKRLELRSTTTNEPQIFGIYTCICTSFPRSSVFSPNFFFKHFSVFFFFGKQHYRVIVHLFSTLFLRPSITKKKTSFVTFKITIRFFSRRIYQVQVRFTFLIFHFCFIIPYHKFYAFINRFKFF